MAVKMNKWNSLPYPKELYHTPIHMAWINMKTRCTNKKGIDFINYGARGINFDPRWIHFANFLVDMQPTYKEGLTLDRIDNSKGYSAANCRWVTRLVQANNKRNNRYIEFNGKKQTLPEWAREVGIKRSTLSMRYYSYRWSIEKCLTASVQGGVSSL